MKKARFYKTDCKKKLNIGKIHTLGGCYAAIPLDRSVFVLQDSHRSHFFDATQVWILPMYNFFLNNFVCTSFVLVY